MRIGRATIFATLTSAVALVVLAAPVLAAPDLGMGPVQAIGLPTTDIRTIVATFIRSVLGLLGIVFVLNIMWGGFLLMTHGGKEDRAAAAKSHIINNIIGMVIIMSSSSITKFLVNAVANATMGSDGGL